MSQSTDGLAITNNIRVSQHTLWVLALVGCLAMLMLATVSAPENFKASNYGTASVLPPPVIKLIKAATRAGTLGVLLLAILSWAKSPRLLESFRMLLPVFLFAMFGFVSVAWSPLKGMTVAQAASFTTLCLLSLGIAFVCYKEKDLERLFAGVVAILVFIAFSLIVLYFLMPACRVLTREASGLFHSTSAGSTMSLGIVLLSLLVSTTNWNWAKWVYVPSVGLFLTVMLLGGNRTGLALAVILSGVAFVCYANRIAVAIAAVGISVVGIAYLCFDPWLAVINDQFGIVDSVVAQGQSRSEFNTWSGRDEMWAKMWKSYYKSPWIGHGYFVSSEKGKLLVWGEWGNWTAHNLFLQTLVTTGLVGMVLLGTHILRVFWGCICLAYRPAGSMDQAVGRIALIIMIWYMGWGFLNSSFVGPLQPESVIYALIVGAVFACQQTRKEPSEVQTENLSVGGVS